MILHINQAIDSSALQKLIDAYNNLEMLEDGKVEALQILFASEGGDNASTEAMIALINTNADITSVVGYSHLYSNGFKLFFEVKCPKVILKETRAMYHLTRNSGLMIFEGNVTHNADYDEYVKKEMSNFHYLQRTNELVNFTEAEMKKIKANYDLWIPEKRLKQMYNYNKKFLNLK